MGRGAAASRQHAETHSRHTVRHRVLPDCDETDPFGRPARTPFIRKNKIIIINYGR